MIAMMAHLQDRGLLRGIDHLLSFFSNRDICFTVKELVNHFLLILISPKPAGSSCWMGKLRCKSSWKTSALFTFGHFLQSSTKEVVAVLKKIISRALLTTLWSNISFASTNELMLLSLELIIALSGESIISLAKFPSKAMKVGFFTNDFSFFLRRKIRRSLSDSFSCIASRQAKKLLFKMFDGFLLDLALVANFSRTEALSSP